MAQRVKSPAMQGTQEAQVQSLGGEDPLEKEMATHSCILDWGIPWTEEPGRLQSKGLQRGGHNWVIKQLHATKHYIYFMCTTLYLNFCPNFSPLTTKSLVSITIQSTSFIHIALPSPIPSGQHCSGLCISVFICSVYLDSTYDWASLVAQRLKHLSGMWRPQFDPWVGKIPWRRKWQPTPVLLLGEVHGGRSLIGYSPRGRKESDMTERLHFTYDWNYMVFVFLHLTYFS